MATSPTFCLTAIIIPLPTLRSPFRDHTVCLSTSSCCARAFGVGYFSRLNISTLVQARHPAHHSDQPCNPSLRFSFLPHSLCRPLAFSFFPSHHYASGEAFRRRLLLKTQLSRVLQKAHWGQCDSFCCCLDYTANLSTPS